MQSPTPASSVDYSPQSWISGREARRVASLTPSRLWQYVATGHVKSIAPPGVSTQFNREDVERIAAEMNAARQPV